MPLTKLVTSCIVHVPHCNWRLLVQGETRCRIPSATVGYKARTSAPDHLWRGVRSTRYCLRRVGGMLAKAKLDQGNTSTYALEHFRGCSRERLLVNILDNNQREYNIRLPITWLLFSLVNPCRTYKCMLVLGMTKAAVEMTAHGAGHV